MRWDETTGMHPVLPVRRSRGPFGFLECTEVSGSGKKVVPLPIFVPDKAFLIHRWLCAGFELLLQQELGFKRDY